MDSFFSELKAARERKGISLAEISDATLISLKMLEALERGNVTVVPQAYIRAFLRAYAGVVGLDIDETMTKYEEWLNGKNTPTALPPHPAPVDAQPEGAEQQESSRDKFQRLAPMFFKITIAIVVLVLVDIALWSVLEKEPTLTVKETSFRDAVRENEERAGFLDTTQQGISSSTQNRPLAKRDSASARLSRSVAPPIIIDSDSMTLVAITTDSVWMEIVLDDDVLTEHYFYPKTTFTWKAKNEFWISAIGNPHGIKLALNNKPIAIPIKPGYVTRDVRLTRESLNTQ